MTCIEEIESAEHQGATLKIDTQRYHVSLFSPPGLYPSPCHSQYVGVKDGVPQRLKRVGQSLRVRESKIVQPFCSL